MPENWKTYKIGDITSEVFSGGTPSTKKEEYYGGNIPWLNTKEIDFQNIRYTEKFISELGLQKSSAKWVPKNAVIIAMYGNTAGKSAITKIPLTTNQACCNLVINPEKADYRFVYYRVLNDYKLIKDLSVGGAQQNLNAGTIKNYEIKLPSLKEQKSIASILSALDDKIELNLQMNKTLEEMAMALYKHWFVDFGPFQDGEFVDSELGEIPKGWEVLTLSDVTSKITDGAHHSPKSVAEGKPMASVKDMDHWGFNIETCRKISEEDYIKLTNQGCRPLKNDVVIAKDGSYLKHAFVIEKDLDIVLLSSIAILKPNGKLNSHLLNLNLKLDSVKTRMKAIVSGAAIQRIVLKEFRKFLIIVPPKDIQDSALQSIENLMKQCWNNNSENQTLTQLRDTLLPKLISGEVRVKDVEKTLTEVL
ncbi:MAG: restriction endonuclease subunit S [Gillisia sp.]